MSASRRWIVALAAGAAGLAGCRDESLSPAPTPVPERHLAQALVCAADRTGVQCRQTAPVVAATAQVAALGAGAAARALEAPVSSDGAQPTIVFGGNGSRFALELALLGGPADRFDFSVRLRNTLGQSMGTADGTTAHPDGIRVGLLNDPVALAGSGLITPFGSSGTATFGTPDRPYWQVSSEILRAGDQIQSATLLQFEVPTTVQRFEFRLLLSAVLADESETGLRPSQNGFDNFAIGPFGGCGTRADGWLWCWGRNDEGQLATGAQAASYSAGNGLIRGVSLALGQHHLCTSNVGTLNLSCTGSNGAGQLAYGFTGGYSELLGSAIPSVFVGDLSAGGDNTCGFTPAQVLICWGDNQYGQLAREPSGLPSSGVPFIVEPPPGVTFNRVFVGRAGTSCALAPTGEAYCWGRNDAGQVGSGAAAGPNVTTPTLVAGGRTWLRLAIGDAFACGIDRNDRTTWCWGDGTFAQLGGAVPSSLVPVQLANVPTAETITAGAAFACVSSVAGAVHCWGKNDHGQLGRGPVGAPAAPAPVDLGAGPWAQVVAGARHACARPVADGNFLCWGDNRQGQLQQERAIANVASPVVVSTIEATSQLVGGHETTCVARDVGGGSIDFECFGSAAGMQLGGTGRPGSQVQPLGALSPSRWISVGTGDGHACALNERLVPYCWGRGQRGQLGVGVGASTAQPNRVQVGTDSAFFQLSVGYDHACAIRASDNALFCWGRNDFGQVGTGSTFDVFTPTRITSAQYRHVVAGPLHTCALTLAGELQCWGANAAGQVGNGTTVDVTAPVTIVGRTVETFVLGGDGDPASGFTCLLDGIVSCWGNGSDGQLGTGTTASSAAPVASSAVNSTITASLLQLAAGRAHACALATDDGAPTQVFCWGAGGEGQITPSTNTQARFLSPVRLLDATGSSRVTATSDRTCFEQSRLWYCYGGRSMLGERGTGRTGIAGGVEIVP